MPMSAADLPLPSLEFEVKVISLLGTVAAAVLLSAGMSHAADDKGADKNARSCFNTRDWEGWSAPEDGDTLYLRVNRKDIYRVDLIPGSHVRKDADNFLINRVRGSNFICSPIDLDLVLSDHSGLKQPLMVKTMRKLRPDEVAAIPKKDLP